MRLVPAALVCLGAATGGLAAQEASGLFARLGAEPWAEMRLGVAVPGEPFRTGPEFGGRIGAGAALSVRGGAGIWGPLGLQAGVSRYDNPCETDGCGVGKSWRTTTIDLGLRGEHAWRGVQLWAFGGVIFPWLVRPRPGLTGEVRNRVRVAGEGGLGVRLPLAGRFELTPGFRFTSYNAVYDGVAGTPVRLMVLDLGVHYRF